MINYLTHKIFLLTPSLEGWPTKANKAPSPREVRLTLPDIIPVFLCFRDKLVIVFYPNKINVPSRITPLWRQCFLFFSLSAGLQKHNKISKLKIVMSSIKIKHEKGSRFQESWLLTLTN